MCIVLGQAVPVMSPMVTQWGNWLEAIGVTGQGGRAFGDEHIVVLRVVMGSVYVGPDVGVDVFKGTPSQPL